MRFFFLVCTHFYWAVLRSHAVRNSENERVSYTTQIELTCESEQQIHRLKMNWSLVSCLLSIIFLERANAFMKSVLQLKHNSKDSFILRSTKLVFDLIVDIAFEFCICFVELKKKSHEIVAWIPKSMLSFNFDFQEWITYLDLFK